MSVEGFPAPTANLQARTLRCPGAAHSLACRFCRLERDYFERDWRRSPWLARAPGLRGLVFIHCLALASARKKNNANAWRGVPSDDRPGDLRPPVRSRFGAGCSQSYRTGDPNYDKLPGVRELITAIDWAERLGGHMNPALAPLPASQSASRPTR